MFSRWTVAKKVSGVVAVGLTAFVLIGFLSYGNIKKLVKTADWVTHTHEVLEANEQILSLVKDAETGQRGYIVTGEQSYLKPYRKAVDSMRASIQEAKQLTSDNPAQQGRIAEIESLTASKLGELKETIDLRAEKGFEDARKVVATNRGQHLMDKIGEKIGEIEGEERTLLKQRSEDALASAQT